MLSKILKLKNVKKLSKNDQRSISGGFDDDPCGNTPWWQQQCQDGRVYAICDYSSNNQICNPCVFCVN